MYKNIDESDMICDSWEKFDNDEPNWKLSTWQPLHKYQDQYQILMDIGNYEGSLQYEIWRPWVLL